MRCINCYGHAPAIFTLVVIATGMSCKQTNFIFLLRTAPLMLLALCIAIHIYIEYNEHIHYLHIQWNTTHIQAAISAQIQFYFVHTHIHTCVGIVKGPSHLFASYMKRMNCYGHTSVMWLYKLNIQSNKVALHWENWIWQDTTTDKPNAMK